MSKVTPNIWNKKKLTHVTRQKPHIFSQWASISQKHKKDGVLTQEGEAKLQNFMLEELDKEVAKTKQIEKENERLINLVNHMKKAFIKAK